MYSSKTKEIQDKISNLWSKVKSRLKEDLLKEKDEGNFR